MVSDADYMDILATARRKDPELYAEQMLGIKWSPKQKEIVQALLQYKRVFVQGHNSMGKSNLAGGLANWHFDSFNPGLTITTAPDFGSVEQVIWKEIRRQRGNRTTGLRDVDCKLQYQGEPDHYMLGTTSATGEGFKGRHEENMLFFFDEAVGIKGGIWDATHTMMQGPGRLWVCICNPTDTSSRAYAEISKAGTPWHIIIASALTHPNVLAGLKGEPLPFPRAIQVSWVDSMVRQNCTEIDPRDRLSRDFDWSLPDLETGKRDLDNPLCYRPDATFESAVLGQWPSSSTGSIWSDSAWLAATRHKDSGLKPIPDSEIYNSQLEIGCDVAWTANDKTSLIGRRGMAALTHKTGSGWRPPRIADELKAAAVAGVQDDFRRKSSYLQNYVGEDAHMVAIKCDHDATGNSLIEYMVDWNFSTLSGARTAISEDCYNNGRSEGWFTVAELADNSFLDISRLPTSALNDMRIQAMAQKWHMDGKGKRCADSKQDTRKILQRSPDDIDALNLAFAQSRSAIMRMPGTLLPDGTYQMESGLYVATAGAVVRTGKEWGSPMSGGYSGGMDSPNIVPGFNASAKPTRLM